MPGDDATHGSRRALVVEIGLASVGILAALALIKHLAVAVSFLSGHAFTLAAAVQLYAPIVLRNRLGFQDADLGLTLARWRDDLRLAAVWSVVVTVPFALGHHLWQTRLFHRSLTWRAPDDLLEMLLVQVLAVGLAEELFFRGYLQGRLERLWPARRRLWGAPFGAAVVTAAVVFALAHFVGEYRPARLGPFFPALLFGWLRARTGTIVGAVLFHAYCNILGEILWTLYRP